MTTRALVLMGFLGLFGCEKRGELREWRPEDHAGYRAEPAAAPAGSAPAANPSPAPADPSLAIAGLYRVQCAGCHGVGGLGDGPAKPPGAPMPDFTSAAWQVTRTDEDLARSIHAGKNMMPAFGTQLEAESIARLVVHVRRFAAAAP